MVLRTILLFLLVCLASCANEEPPPTPAAISPETQIALVGPYPVTMVDLEQAVAAIFGEQEVPQGRNLQDLETAVDALVAARLLVLEAEEKGVAQAPDIVATVDSLERILLKQAIYEQDVYADLPEPTEDQITALFGEWGSGEQILGAHIMVRSEERALSIIEQLEQGVSFADLAREHSIHQASSRFGGGMGYLRRSLYPTPIADAIWDLPVGDYGVTPVKTRMGWHVVACDGRRTQSLEKQREGLVNELIRRQKRAADERFVIWLRTQYELRYHPETAVAVASLSDTLSGHRQLFSWKGNGELTLAGFLQRVQVPDPVSQDTARMRLLAEGVVFDELAAIEARQRGHGGSTDVRKKLQDKRFQLISQRLFERTITPTPTPEQVRAFYDEHRERFRSHTRVTVREILVDRPAAADSLHGLVVAGESLEDLARKHTVRTDLAKTGGYWPDVTPGDPRSGGIYQAALKHGLGLHPPLKVNGGHSLFEVLQISPGPIMGLEEAEGSVRASLNSQRMEELIRRLREAFVDRISIDRVLLARIAVDRD